MFVPGDIVGFYSPEARKHKYHLCISIDGHYIFLNSPKPKMWPADFYVANGDLPGIPPTATGQSIVCCSTVMQKTNVELRSAGASSKGRCSNDLLRRIVGFVENCVVLSEEEKEAVIGGLADWV
jgi:hypothetical protein